jgi:hypothetical protein
MNILRRLAIDQVVRPTQRDDVNPREAILVLHPEVAQILRDVDCTRKRTQRAIKLSGGSEAPLWVAKLHRSAQGYCLRDLTWLEPSFPAFVSPKFWPPVIGMCRAIFCLPRGVQCPVTDCTPRYKRAHVNSNGTVSLHPKSETIGSCECHARKCESVRWQVEYCSAYIDKKFFRERQISAATLKMMIVPRDSRQGVNTRTHVLKTFPDSYK